MLLCLAMLQGADANWCVGCGARGKICHCQPCNHVDLVWQVPYFPPTQSLADFPPEECARLLAAAIGDGGEAEELRIHSIRAWTMHAEVADRFKVPHLPLNPRICAA